MMTRTSVERREAKRKYRQTVPLAKKKERLITGLMVKEKKKHEAVTKFIK